MPGVKVVTSVRTGPSNPPGPASARYFTAGLTERGPVGQCVRVASIAQYEATFGPRTTYAAAMWDDAQLFFEEGGTELFVNRAVGAAAAPAALSLNDNATSPRPTLRVEALNPGAWGQALSVEVTAGALPTSSTITVYLAGSKVEQASDLTAPADFAAAFANSRYVRVLNLASTTAAPANRPAVLARTALAGGTDDRAAVGAAAVLQALGHAGAGFGTGAVAAPGYTADVIGAGLIAHAKAHNRIALLHADSDVDEAELAALAATLTADGDYAGLFHPWLTVPDGSATRLVPPVGYVAGARARAHALTGFWQPPAGTRSEARFALGTATDLDQATNDQLAASRVSGITRTATTTRLYGWYSLSTSEAFRLLSVRDFLNTLTWQVSEALDPFVWTTVDGRGQLLSRVDGVIRGILQPISDAGGLFPKIDASGKQLDPGYSVQVDSATTTADLLNNEVKANIGVRTSPSASLLLVSIVKAALNAAV